jgi:hypothetical protein
MALVFVNHRAHSSYSAPPPVLSPLLVYIALCYRSLVGIQCCYTSIIVVLDDGAYENGIIANEFHTSDKETAQHSLPNLLVLCYKTLSFRVASYIDCLFVR